MAPSSVVNRVKSSSLTASTPALEIYERVVTTYVHGFTVGQVLRRNPTWALASADLPENVGTYIVMKTGPRFFDIAKFDGPYDLVTGFSNADRGKKIRLDWRPANIGKMTLDQPPGFEYCQVLGEVIDAGRILIRPEPLTIAEDMGVGIIDLNNHGIARGQVFDRNGAGVRLASAAANDLFLGNLLAGRVTANRIWYPTTPTEYDFNNHGWTLGAVYYVGLTAGTPTTVPPPAGQDPVRQLPLFVPVSANRILYLRAFQPI